MSDFITRLDMLMEEKDVNDKELVETLGIGKNSITYWRKNGNLPKGDILTKLASYFDVSTDYLLGKIDKEKMETTGRILQLIEDKGAKMSYLEKTLGFRRGLITDWKLHRSTPTQGDIEKIAEFFNVNVDWILGKSPSPSLSANDDEEQKKSAHNDELTKSVMASLDKRPELKERLTKDPESRQHFLDAMDANVELIANILLKNLDKK